MPTSPTDGLVGHAGEAGNQLRALWRWLLDKLCESGTRKTAVSEDEEAGFGPPLSPREPKSRIGYEQIGDEVRAFWAGDGDDLDGRLEPES